MSASDDASESRASESYTPSEEVFNKWPAKADDKYEHLGRLGSGSFGDVYKARRRCDGVEVAVKVVRGTSDALKEVQMHQSLRHVGVCPILDSFHYQVTTGESEGMTGKGAKARASTESTLGRVTSSNSVDEGTDIVLCIVMELCPDGSLLEHLRRTGKPLRERDCIDVSQQLLLALQYIHEKGILHRDIKPENVLINTLGRVVITDFGLGKQIFDLSGKITPEVMTHIDALSPRSRFAAPHVSTSSSMASLLGEGCQQTGAVGTYGFMAPEVMDFKDYTFAADIWSFGCLIYILLTGTGPFDHTGEDPQEDVKRRSKNCQYARIPDPVTDLARDFVAQCLVVDQEERATIPQLLSHAWISKVHEKEKGALLTPLMRAFENLCVFQSRREVARGRFYKVVKAICGIARINMSLKRKARETLEGGSKASAAAAAVSYKAARQPPA